jgi:hypothetical protein
MFLREAGFRHDWKEADLQEYLIKYYRRQGWDVRDEVTNRFGRADLVINKGGDKYVIEIKKWLTRDNLLQAKGQVEGYAVCLAQEEDNSTVPLNKIIMGLLPTDLREQTAALSQAERNKIMGVDVIFVDQHPKYYYGQWAKGQRVHDAPAYDLTQTYEQEQAHYGPRKRVTLWGAIWKGFKEWIDNVEIVIDLRDLKKKAAIVSAPMIWFIRITLDIAGIKSSRRRPRSQKEKFLASVILYVMFALLIINMPAIAAGIQAFSQIISQVIK